MLKKMNTLLEYFSYDEIASDTWLSKYAAPGETTPDDMHWRMAKEFGSELYKKVNLHTFNTLPDDLSSVGKKVFSELIELSEEEVQRKVYEKFKDFSRIVPQGSVMTVLGRKDIIGSLSNCFVIGKPIDSYGGIFQFDQHMGQLMKRRGGVGGELSSLRPKGVKTRNVAKTSTGAASFAHRFSNTTNEVAQDGRRGALMLTMLVMHPDIKEFINLKIDQVSVTGANISVQLTDNFMRKVERDEDFILQWPVEGFDPSYFVENSDNIEYDVLYPLNYTEVTNGDETGYFKKVRAKEIYDLIVKNAHAHAEPGQMFVDRHHNYSPDGVYYEYRMVTTNPCGEIGMSAYDACRLICLNMYSYVLDPFSKDSKFDFEAFEEDAFFQQLLADVLVDLEAKAIERIIRKVESDPEDDSIKKIELELWKKIKDVCLKARRTGSGFTALGDTLAALGKPYSMESEDTIAEIMKTKMSGELKCTIDLALLEGPFTNWDRDSEYLCEGFKRTGENDFFQMLLEEFPEEIERMIKYGRRNVSWSTVAPTGTVSLMTQTTSGMEPLFSPYYMRRKKINENDTNSRVDFVDELGVKWQEYPILHPKFKEWLKIEYKPLTDGDSLTDEDISLLDNKSLGDLFFMSPWYKSTANDIDWIERITIQAIIQKYTSHSISSTINLPKSATVEEVSEIYMEAWKQGLKGVTVYRDGSRQGVLIQDTVGFEEHDAPKRPKVLEGEVHIVTVKGVKYNVIIGLLEGKVYEVFAHYTEGTSAKPEVTKITKLKSGEYQYESNNNTISVTLDMSDEEEAITRLTSTALRHGANIKFVAEQLNKTKGDLTNFSKAMARVLKKYISNGEKSTLKCLECGSKEIIFEEGCEKCTSCGSSKCG